MNLHNIFPRSLLLATALCACGGSGSSSSDAATQLDATETGRVFRGSGTVMLGSMSYAASTDFMCTEQQDAGFGGRYGWFVISTQIQIGVRSIHFNFGDKPMVSQQYEVAVGGALPRRPPAGQAYIEVFSLDSPYTGVSGSVNVQVSGSRFIIDLTNVVMQGSSMDRVMLSGHLETDC